MRQPAPSLPHQHPGDAAVGAPPRTVLGIQPVLLAGMVLLVLVTLLAIVLILVGDIATQGARVAWTVVAVVGFTVLLALDLALARRSSVPLVVGVVANVYLLAMLMVATWVEPAVAVRVDPYAVVPEPELGVAYRLLGVHLLALVVVRAGAAGAWGLVALGRRGAIPVARATGLVAAGLVGLAAVLLTLHLAIGAFGIEPGDAYWRLSVVVVVLAALGACITALLYWSRRQLEGRRSPATPPRSGRTTGPQHPYPQPHPSSQRVSDPVAQQPWAHPGAPPRRPVDRP